MLSFLDAYTIRARLFPAIIGVLPAPAVLALLITWTNVSLTNILATLAIFVIMFVLADFARRQGKRIEPKIYAEMGGKPSVTIMRYSDNHLNSTAKDRYRSFLAGKLNVPAPREQDERSHPKEADAFYEQAATWLRENTRDTKRFSILFNENVTYGFRRNLFGAEVASIDLERSCGRACALRLADLVAALYVAFVVGKSALKEASRTHARQLILSCEALMSAPPLATKAGGPKRRATSTD